MSDRILPFQVSSFYGQTASLAFATFGKGEVTT